MGSKTFSFDGFLLVDVHVVLNIKFYVSEIENSSANDFSAEIILMHIH